MNSTGILSTVQTLEGMFGSQFESVLADGTRALGASVNAELTDEEIAISARVERKIIFGGLNTVLTPKPAVTPVSK